jgi:DNA-binding response OmpR family regulator
MSRILLVDDSTHAQRMGERILTAEGHEVVTVSNAETALIRLEDVDPDVVIADTVMPGRTGFEICQFVKMSPKHRHVRVVLTAGVLEPLDEVQVQRVEADGSLKKPFEATVLTATIKVLGEAAERDRAERPETKSAAPAAEKPSTSTPFVAVIDAEQVRAAVTMALDGSMDAIVDAIAQRVVDALRSAVPAATPVEFEPDEATVPSAAAKPAAAAAAREAAPMPLTDARPVERVRRVTVSRPRSGSILGLDLGGWQAQEPESPPPPAGAALPKPAGATLPKPAEAPVAPKEGAEAAKPAEPEAPKAVDAPKAQEPESPTAVPSEPQSPAK